MAQFTDFTGVRLGQLLVLTRVANTERGESCWLVRCNCGVEKVVTAMWLKKEKGSCGCSLICWKCKQEKPYTKEFFPMGKIRRRVCHSCLNKYSKVYQDSHKSAVAVNNKRWYETRYLEAKYGITKDTYQKMFESQNGLCKICKSPPGQRRLSVDHNHKTGEVRGLLCGLCNTALGSADDNIGILEAMISYLRGSIP